MQAKIPIEKGDHLFRDFSAKSSLFPNIIKDEKAVDRGNGAGDLQNFESRKITDFNSACESEEIFRRELVSWIKILVVVSMILRYVTLFVILLVPGLVAVVAIGSVGLLLTDGVLVWALKAVVNYYFQNIREEKGK